MTALEAMKLSERENRIVSLEYFPQLAADLFQDCDGHVEANGVLEYWGNDPESEHKMSWRVHLARKT